MDVAHQGEIEQVGGFDEETEATVPRLVGRQLHAEVLILPDVVVVPVGDVGQALADEAAGELGIEAEAVVAVQQREVGHVGGLAEERTILAHGDDVVALHGALVGGDAREGVGVVKLDAEGVEVFQQVDFQAGVAGVAEVERHVVCILAFVNQTVLNGVL